MEMGKDVKFIVDSLEKVRSDFKDLDSFRAFVGDLIKTKGANRAIDFIIGFPHGALVCAKEEGIPSIKEDVLKYAEMLTGHRDLVAERLSLFIKAVAALPDPKNLPREFKEFDEIAGIILEIGQKQAWPIRGEESGTIGGFRYFCPSDKM